MGTTKRVAERKKRETVQSKLSEADQEQLHGLMTKGVESVRVLKRARILQLLDAGWGPIAVCKAVGVSPPVVRRVGWRYTEEGLAAALHERPRPGNPKLLGAPEQTRIVAMVCSSPPAGYARWNVRLIAREAVKKKLVARVGRETVRELLKKHHLKPWREKKVVRRGTGRRVPGENGGRAGGVRTPVQPEGAGDLL